MVARSHPSLRRSSRRGDQASSAASVTEIQPPGALILSHRAKRNRIPSISDAENLQKKRKTDHFDNPSHYKFPLRSRPNDEPLQPLPLKNGATPVSPIQKKVNPTTGVPIQDHINKAAAQKKPQQWQCPHSNNDKRSLRSQDGGSRSKSELSLYFTNYEQMLSLEAAKPGTDTPDHNNSRLIDEDLLTAKTQITLIDDLVLFPVLQTASLVANHNSQVHDSDPFGSRNPLHNAHRVDLTLTFQGHTPRRIIKDSLPEDVFHKAHRKAERHEKQLRNIEKERAQHEKVQLDRLLEELKGPDWLKVMGISGITESEKKLYEPKRVFFVREVAGLIEKFRHWKEEEKRRKLEREQALLAEEEGLDDKQLDEDDEDDDDDSEQEITSPQAPISPITTSSPPDTNDVDAAAARQLHQEAISASSSSNTAHPRKKKLPIPSSTHPPPLLLRSSPSQKDPGFFFAKSHMREAAIAGHRRGRNKLVFGEPVPDPEVQDFQLPSSILTRETIRQRARLKRRLKRGSSE
jgi:Something about silencing, SAS, complex subunit 4